jgi:hypothetical protein
MQQLYGAISELENLYNMSCKDQECEQRLHKIDAAAHPELSQLEKEVSAEWGKMPESGQYAWFRLLPFFFKNYLN